MKNFEPIEGGIYSFKDYSKLNKQYVDVESVDFKSFGKYPKYHSFFKRGFFNTILFKWLSPIIDMAEKDFLINDSDINLADDDDDIQTEYLYFIRNWNEEFSKPQAINSIQLSTFKVIFRTFYLRIITILLFKLVFDIIQMCRPWQIHGILHWIGDPAGTKASGIMRFMSVVICEVVCGSILQQYFRRSFSLSVMLKGVMNYSLSNKLIKLPKNVAIENSAKCISLFSSESTYLLGTGNSLLAVPSMIFQNLLLLFSLYQFIGVSAFIGYIIIVLSLFVNGLLIKLTQSVRLKYISSLDKRISLSTELVNSFKQIKCYAWEKYYIKNINEIRNEEIKHLAIWRFLNQFGFVLATLCVSLSPVISFGSFLYLTRTFPADVIFTSLLIFESLQLTLVLLPTGISSLQKIINCYTRLSEFLLLKDIDSRQLDLPIEQQDYAVKVNDVYFSYPSKEYILSSISFNVKKSQKVGIIGYVGSGKTTMLELILQELTPKLGSVQSVGSVFYCPQSSWITSASIRSNIILDLPFDQAWYDTVITACSLVYDLKAMPNGDLTEIGENGINLSGGQKQRVSLARAIYQNTDILILDDVFSALDNVVATSIFQKCIINLLKHKTVILATNKLDILSHLDQVIFINNKTLSYSGPPDNSFFSHPDFQDLLNNMYKVQNQINQIIDDVVTIEEIHDIGAVTDDQLSVNSSDIQNPRQDSSYPTIRISETITSIPKNEIEPETSTQNNSSPSLILPLSNQNTKTSQVSRRGSRVSLSALKDKYRRESQTLRNSIELTEEDNNYSIKKTAKMLDQASVKVKSVEFSKYIEYIKKFNPTILALSIIVIYSCTLSNILSSVWISNWSRDFDKYGILQGLLILTAINILQPILNLLFRIANIYLTTNASKKIYNELFTKLSYSKLSFYESIPIGTILTRITSDIVVIDEMIPQNLIDFTYCLTRVTIYIGYFIYLDYRFILIFLPASYFFNRFRIRAMSANRQLKRIFHSRTSPILTSISYTIDGLAILRCSKYGFKNFIQNIQNLIDYESAPWRCYCLIQRWLGIHIDMLGAFIISSLGIFCVSAKGFISIGAIAIAFQCSLSLTQLVLWMIRNISETENNFLSYDRTSELINIIPQETNIEKGTVYQDEDDYDNSYTAQETNGNVENTDSLLINIDSPNRPIPSNWPSNGSIVFNNVVLRYNPDEPAILNNLSFSVQGGKKVGICGRTGSGKSTLLSAILRLYNIQQGNIIIDDIDISQISLKKLRSQITIIPQEPNILTGTLRYNLDPFNEYSLEEINQALINSNSESFVNSLPDGINTQMTNASNNISLGQKQLICLARALLRKSKIILLDEATSSMDIATDNVIQNIIKKHFSNCTILSIAHRIHTIIDYDLIIVLDKGRIVEYDSPQNLLSNTSSMFYSIANETNTL
ncbi:ATP-binding cassette protein [Cryptosporidium ubiquitum]|uniref:ATP-binding cassette protein n=1 Tax=Cryptosporidium ubiquitum TaxID=857276 RepID=A0A1J4MJV3_9CRYT|nr:ATP-binding cassette protein [Cryptosporidium ubiquitum]OII74513.1 ATP-binding cassette protein [Cryptosporidium ubiquitum]